MVLELDEIDQKRLWLCIIEDSKEDLAKCPPHPHAHCKAADAVEFFERETTRTVFHAVYPEDGDRQLDLILRRIIPCPHLKQRRRLRAMMATSE